MLLKENSQISIGILKNREFNKDGKNQYEFFNLKDYEDFLKENSFFINEIEEENLEENNDEIEDDLPKEYTEIVCDNCGHCILIDEIIHQLDS